MKRYSIHLLIVVLCALALVACKDGGLSYAYSYKYEHSPAYTKQACTVYQFIEGKSTGDFSLWFAAINHADMKTVYEQTDLTYFILDDEQFSAWLTSYRYSCVDQVPVSVLQNLLTGYILKGYYTSLSLTTSYIKVPTLNEDYTMRMRLYPSPATSSQNLHSMQVGWEPYSEDLLHMCQAVTSNIECQNGVLHVLNSRLVRKVQQ